MLFVTFVDSPDEDEDEKVDQFKDGEDTCTEEQAQQTSDLAEQAQQLEADLLLDVLVAQVFIEDVDFYEVISATIVVWYG